MKSFFKKGILFLTIIAVLMMFSLSTFAFAGPTNGAVDSSYLQTYNPIYSNPYAYTHGGCNVHVYSMYCIVDVLNTNGTQDNQHDTKYDTTGFNTANQYANTFSSSGVRFNGKIEVTDGNYGNWVGYMSYTY